MALCARIRVQESAAEDIGWICAPNNVSCGNKICCLKSCLLAFLFFLLIREIRIHYLRWEEQQGWCNLWVKFWTFHLSSFISPAVARFTGSSFHSFRTFLPAGISCSWGRKKWAYFGGPKFSCEQWEPAHLILLSLQRWRAKLDWYNCRV